METTYYLGRETLLPTGPARHGELAQAALHRHGAQRPDGERLLRAAAEPGRRDGRADPALIASHADATPAAPERGDPRAGRTRLRSLASRDLRLFFAGQAVSLAGHLDAASVAQAWLVWRLTRSSEMLGLVNFLGAVPVFLFGDLGGVPRRPPPPPHASCSSRRRTRSCRRRLLAVLTLTGAVRPWHVLVLAAMLGMTYAFEIPARQALLADLAGEDMPNAIALNSSIVNAARVVGPALAGRRRGVGGRGLGLRAQRGELRRDVLRAPRHAAAAPAARDGRAAAPTCSRGSPTPAGPRTCARSSRSSRCRASSRCRTRRSSRCSRRRCSTAARGCTASCSPAPAPARSRARSASSCARGSRGLGRRVALGATLLGGGRRRALALAERRRRRRSRSR